MWKFTFEYGLFILFELTITLNSATTIGRLYTAFQHSHLIDERCGSVVQHTPTPTDLFTPLVSKSARTKFIQIKQKHSIDNKTNNFMVRQMLGLDFIAIYCNELINSRIGSSLFLCWSSSCNSKEFHEHVP